MKRSIQSLLAALLRWPLRMLVGLVLTTTQAYALECPSTQEQQGLLCYPKPRDGYTCNGPLCVENCRNGYFATGIATCHYSGTLTYPERPYPTRSHSNMQRCLALFYDNCRAGYKMQVCGICSYQGAWDITRKSYSRGAGTSPDLAAALGNVGYTFQANWGRAFGDIAYGYNFVNDTVNGWISAQLDAIMAQAVKNVLTTTAATYKVQMKLLSDSLAQQKANPEMANAMARIVVAAARQKPDDQILIDMQAVVDKLDAGRVLYGGTTTARAAMASIAPKEWSLALYLALTGEAPIPGVPGSAAGLTVAVGVAVQIPRPNSAGRSVLTRENFRFYVAPGLLAGVAFDGGGNQMVGVMVQPTSIAGVAGPSLGITGQVGAEEGVGIGLTGAINIPTDFSVFQIGVPTSGNDAIRLFYENILKNFPVSLAVGVVRSTDNSANLEPGYTVLIKF